MDSLNKKYIWYKDYRIYLLSIFITIFLCSLVIYDSEDTVDVKQEEILQKETVTTNNEVQTNVTQEQQLVNGVIEINKLALTVIIITIPIIIVFKTIMRF